MKRKPKIIAPTLTLTPTAAGAFNGTIHMDEAALTIPLRWKRPRRIFVNSMSDLFHKDVPFEFVDKVFAVMGLCPQHTFQVLTKRPERMAEYFHGDRCALTNINNAALSIIAQQKQECIVGIWPLPNVWLGTSVEDQARADERIPWLLKCPAKIRFLSCEPLISGLDLLPYLKQGAQNDSGRSSIFGSDCSRMVRGEHGRDDLEKDAILRRRKCPNDAHSSPSTGGKKQEQKDWGVSSHYVFGDGETSQGCGTQDRVDGCEPEGYSGGIGIESQGREQSQQRSNKLGSSDKKRECHSLLSSSGAKTESANGGGQRDVQSGDISGGENSRTVEPKSHVSERFGENVRSNSISDFSNSASQELGISLVIVGGESGPGARPCNIEWIRSIVRQCTDAGVACRLKQVGANHTGTVAPDDGWANKRFRLGTFSVTGAGSNPAEWPEDLRIQQMPKGD